MRIGIDVGGTNTDAVLLDGTAVLAANKSATSADVTAGIIDTLDRLQAERSFDPAQVQAVMIGTTHFINALVEARRLAPTAALRLGGPTKEKAPPISGAFRLRAAVASLRRRACRRFWRNRRGSLAGSCASPRW